jgi:hypothetical protein
MYYYCSSPTFSTAALGATKSSPKVSEESHSWIDVSELNSSPIPERRRGAQQLLLLLHLEVPGRVPWRWRSYNFCSYCNLLSTASKEVIQ